MLIDAPPAGYRVTRRRVAIGSGAERWRFAVRETHNWGIKLRSGFRLATGESRPGWAAYSSVAAAPVASGDLVWLALRVGPLWIREPVRVSHVIDEERRQGSAYMTRLGHQLDGEELFLVERDDADSVWLTVATVSRPAAGWRWATPVLRLGQWVVRRRYLRALEGPTD